MDAIDPEVQLDHTERAYLVQVMGMPGYKIQHKLMRSEVDKFIVAVINADPANRGDVLSRQVLMKAAAQFYEGITKRWNEEMLLYTQAPKASDTPIDITEGVLDLGTVVEALDAVPNLL